MSLIFELDPAVDRTLHDGLVALWTDVSNYAAAPSASCRR